jgi:hypothetical protein
VQPFVKKISFASLPLSQGLQNSFKANTEVEKLSSSQSEIEVAQRQLCQMLIQDFFEDMYKGNQYFISRINNNPDSLINIFKDNLKGMGVQDSSYSSLFEAICHLENGDLNATSSFGISIFMEALSGKWGTKPKTIEFFISLGVDIHSESLNHLRPLMFVLHNKLPWKNEIINILLNSGVNLSEKDSRSRTFLMNYLREPFSFGEAEKHILNRLLLADNSWKYTTCDMGYSAIMYAAQAVNKPVVKFLLEQGAAENEPLAREALTILSIGLHENRQLEMLEIGSFRAEALDRFNLLVKEDDLSDLETYFSK